MDDGLVLKFKMWGVRGSIPTPISDQEVRYKQASLLDSIVKEIDRAGTVDRVFGADRTIETYLQYLRQHISLPVTGTFGGNTSCFEIQAINSPLCIVDAGSGIRHLGDYLLKDRFFKGKSLNPLAEGEIAKKQVHLFLTHYHWDHIQGFPFFAPAFMKELEIKFYGKYSSTVQLNEVLRGQQASHYFPVSWKDLPCLKECYELPRFNPHPILLGEVAVTYNELDHPGTSFGYCFETRGKRVVIATDCEHREIPPPNVVKLAKNASVLYWDAQYLPEEYRGEVGMSKYGWGHGTYEFGILCALQANVKCLLLGHHEPTHNDFDLVELAKRAISYRDQQLQLPQNQGKHLDVLMAHEGASLEVFVNGTIQLTTPCGEIKRYSS